MVKSLMIERKNGSQQTVDELANLIMGRLEIAHYCCLAASLDAVAKGGVNPDAYERLWRADTYEIRTGRFSLTPFLPKG